MIVAPYIGILALLGVVLASQIMAIRLKTRISMGDGKNETLSRRINVFRNFSEYAALIGVILIANELNGAPSWVLHVVGLLAVIGRYMHAIAFQSFIKSVKLHLLFRQPAMVMTIASIVIGAVALIL